MNGYIALIGLGATGSPLAHKLCNQYPEDFVLLADETHKRKLLSRPIMINEQTLNCPVVSSKAEIERPVRLIFVCVKNYNIEGVSAWLRDFISGDTIIVPLQNGLYSQAYFMQIYKDNAILEAFVLGPNTKVREDGISYKNAGEIHLGSSLPQYKESAREVCQILTHAGLKCCLHENIQHEIWKKLMLNVAGNAVTALTGIDYCMIKDSPETQALCRSIMEEFVLVANRSNVALDKRDIESVMEYFIGYKQSKHTSMLEDIINGRKTENEYLAGDILRKAHTYNIDIPRIEALYRLMKIKEQVVLNEL